MSNAVQLTIQSLLAAAGVTAIVGTRVYPQPLRQGTVNPAIGIALTSENDDYHLGGANEYPNATVAVHCTDDDAKGAQTLGEAVKDALQNKKGTVGSNSVVFRKAGTDFTDYAEDFSVHRRVMTWDLRWR